MIKIREETNTKIVLIQCIFTSPYLYTYYQPNEPNKPRNQWFNVVFSCRHCFMGRPYGRRKSRFGFLPSESEDGIRHRALLCEDDHEKTWLEACQHSYWRKQAALMASRRDGVHKPYKGAHRCFDGKEDGLPIGGDRHRRKAESGAVTMASAIHGERISHAGSCRHQ